VNADEFLRRASLGNHLSAREQVLARMTGEYSGSAPWFRSDSEAAQLGRHWRKARREREQPESHEFMRWGQAGCLFCLRPMVHANHRRPERQVSAETEARVRALLESIGAA